VAPGIHVIGLLVVNVVLVEGADGWTLIDAGTVGTLPMLRAGLRRRGVDLSDLKRILITHAHPDHVGGLAALVAASGAEVWAGAVERTWVETEAWPPRSDPATLGALGRRLSRIPTGRAEPVAVSRSLLDDEVLAEIRPDVRTVALPGHTPGQLGFCFEASGVVVVGDALMHLWPWWHPPFAAFSSDMQAARRSVERLAALAPRAVVVGHGPPVATEPGRSLAPRLRRALERFPGDVTTAPRSRV